MVRITPSSFFKKWKIQIRRGYLEFCILTLIKSLESTYGFEIISELKTAELEIKEGTLYPLLNRLVEEGLLKNKWDLNNENSRPRKLYTLTAPGLKQLKLMQDEFVNINEQLNCLSNKKNHKGKNHEKSRKIRSLS